MGGKIIPLNIVMTYPVYWNKFGVFRDFIQNFYDSVDCHEWSKKFHYTYNEDKLCMYVDDVTFNYEWLVHIGASTKTNSDGNSAGYFGEGFKIASLCAFRDFHMDITMSSGDWKLNVTKIHQSIDDKDIEMLAYNLMSKEFSNSSCLELSPVTENDFQIFEDTMNSFYYPENPLIGETIFEGKNASVYLCNTDNYNFGMPYTYDFQRKGAVFCANQLRGSNPFGLVVCLNKYKQKDRERNTLYDFEVTKVLGDAFSYISADASVVVLEKMRTVWNSVPKKHIDLKSWGPVVKMLIYNISDSENARKMFVDKYPNLLYLPPTNCGYDEIRRKFAMEWLKNQDGKYKAVQVSFRNLGYPSLEQKCEEEGGFIDYDLPGRVENDCMQILEEIVQKIYKGFFDIDESMPTRKIINNPHSSMCLGLAEVIKRKKRIFNNQALAIKYDVNSISLAKILFQKDKFFNALSVYVHECCHAFGGDASQSFSNALTRAMCILMSNVPVITEYQKKWEALFG